MPNPVWPCLSEVCVRFSRVTDREGLVVEMVIQSYCRGATRGLGMAWRVYVSIWHLLQGPHTPDGTVKAYDIGELKEDSNHWGTLRTLDWAKCMEVWQFCLLKKINKWQSSGNPNSNLKTDLWGKKKCKRMDIWLEVEHINISLIDLINKYGMLFIYLFFL